LFIYQLQASVLEHDKNLYDVTLLMARVRAYMDLAKHTMDLKSTNDAFVCTMDELKSSKSM